MGQHTPEWDSSYPEFDIYTLPTPSKASLTPIREFLKVELSPQLIKHYGWGFKRPEPGAGKSDLRDYIARILYYTQPKLLPSLARFKNCDSDAGPGLLRPECGALPFSIYYPPPSRDQTTGEYFQKAILRYPYRSLERIPSAVLSLPTSNKNTHIPPQGQRSLGNRHVRCGPTGDDGVRGALNCALVAAHLLDAGYTEADRVNPYWLSNLSDQEKTFLDLISWTNWRDLSATYFFNGTPDALATAMFEPTLPLRHKIITEFQKRQEEKGNRSIVQSLWESCTKSFQQFLVRYEQHPTPNKACSPESPNTVIQSTTRCIPLTAKYGDPLKNTIEAQMARFFTNDYMTKCRCSGPKYDRANIRETHKHDIRVQRRFRELPLRLAFTTAQKNPPYDHTASDIIFDYHGPKGEWKGAKYRWLGGIYPIKDADQYRYIVFWNHHERYEPDGGQFRRYDPLGRHGEIREGLESENSSERVPLPEWKDGQPALLFYEKVIEPPKDFILEVQRAITKYMGSINRSYDPPSVPGKETPSRTAPTNPQLGPPSQHSPHPSRGRPPRSRTERPRQPTQSLHYESSVPQSQGTTGQRPQNFVSGQQQSTQPQTPQPPDSSWGLAGNPVASNISQHGGSSGGLPPNIFDEGLAEIFQEENAAALSPRLYEATSIPPLQPSLDAGFSLSTIVQPGLHDAQDSSYYTNYTILGYNQGSESIHENVSDQPSHNIPATGARAVNSPAGGAGQPAPEPPSSQPPFGETHPYPFEGGGLGSELWSDSGMQQNPRRHGKRGLNIEPQEDWTPRKRQRK
ncbi:hypothetical protein AJ78_04053 [Emergomyces pasteurianus Ep9510]|uniref:Uncharacterized protein n=1 Tax=Emergomyces pasteurianus Ep9510 TaxID=1447872 RepID=A0A1J9PI85_9EURO|nr:hypothetical protein AJ78_04053 [Emergomyces pasteurianus Ep9510]